ncbi:hypothetical protein [Streptomyces sp. MUSC 14]|uniref:hypothetical protein n=1 Tax=Streptomyces sp. MUSC 14 TaxID=1354889 RepID=UPI0011603E8A|nr:hypothetical protein [Streptomyces sp. MUSC 14]
MSEEEVAAVLAAAGASSRLTLDQELAEPIDPAEVLAATHWGALEHAYGPADDVPEMLTGLTHVDEGVRSRALSDVHHVVHHQNTLYTATAPAALYVAERGAGLRPETQSRGGSRGPLHPP